MDGPTKQHTILVVDDTPENIVLITEILKDSYKMKVAPNGEVALRIVNGPQMPDLILLDVMMPGIDGYEVCRRLRDNPRTAHIPVMFQTALADPDDEVRGFGLGAVDYVTKPINPHRLRARVATHLELSDARHRLELQNEALTEAAALREDVDRIMRHDLKAPLNVIIGVPQYLQAAGGLTDEQQEMLSMVEESGQRMLEMINMTLDLMKMERGTYQITPSAVDLIQVTNGAFKDIADLARRKGVPLEVMVNNRPAQDGEQAPIRGEWLLCHSLLANLCKNAIEACPDNTPIIANIQTGNDIRLSLSNQGEVPDDIRGQFFDKYVTSGKSEGTGLGTYSAQLIAHTLGGSIALDCTIPGETTLHVTLPAWDGNDVPELDV